MEDWEKEQRECKVTPNLTSLVTVKGLSFQLWESNLFHFKCFPFMLTSVPDPLLSDFSHMHFLPSLASRQLQAEQFWMLPKGNENAWLCVPA